MIDRSILIAILFCLPLLMILTFWVGAARAERRQRLQEERREAARTRCRVELIERAVGRIESDLRSTRLQGGA